MTDARSASIGTELDVGDAWCVSDQGGDGVQSFFGDGRVGWVAAEDVARVAAAVLGLGRARRREYPLPELAHCKTAMVRDD